MEFIRDKTIKHGNYMRVPATQQQTYNSSFLKTQAKISIKRDSNIPEAQQTQIVAKSVSVKIFSGYDLTNMTSQDMLGLAKSFYEKENTQDFLSLAVFSARAALEDHPDKNITRTWTTPRNENGTFNLLAEIQTTPKYSTGSSVLDDQNEDDRMHLLNTLLSLPIQATTIERSLISIRA